MEKWRCRYCSLDCQALDWAEHRGWCRSVANLFAFYEVHYNCDRHGKMGSLGCSGEEPRVNRHQEVN